MAVNALDMEAMRKRLSAVTGLFVAMSCTPSPRTSTSLPSFTTP